MNKMSRKFFQITMLCITLLLLSSTALASSFVKQDVNLLSSNDDTYSITGTLNKGDVVETLYENKGYAFVAVRQTSNFSLFNKNGWLPIQYLENSPGIPPEDVDINNFVHADLASFKKQVEIANKPETLLQPSKKFFDEVREQNLVIYSNNNYELLLTADLKNIISIKTFTNQLATTAGIKVGDKLAKVMQTYGQYNYTTMRKADTTILSWINPGKKEGKKAILATILQIQINNRTNTVTSISAGEIF